MKDLGLTNYKDKNGDEACKADIVIVKSNMPAKGNYKLFSSEYYAEKYNKDCMHGHGCVLPVNVIGGKQVYLTISNEANNYINNACGIYKEHCISHTGTPNEFYFIFGTGECTDNEFTDVLNALASEWCFRLGQKENGLLSKEELAEMTRIDQKFFANSDYIYSHIFPAIDRDHMKSVSKYLFKNEADVLTEDERLFRELNLYPASPWFIFNNEKERLLLEKIAYEYLLKKGVSVDPGVIDETSNAECVLRIVASDSDAEEIRMTFVSIFGMEIDLKEYYSDSKYYASLNGILKNDERIEKLAEIAKKKRWTFDTTETQWTRDPYTRDKFFRTHNDGKPDEYKRNKAGEKVGFYRCAYCGKLIEKSQVEVDHIVPVNAVRANDSIYRDFLKDLGCESVNDSRNLVAACRECNQKKGASVDLEWIKAGIKLVNNKYIDEDGEEVTQGVFLFAFIILEVALIAITFGIFMLIGKHLSNTLPLKILLFVIDAFMTILIIIGCKECKNEYRKNAKNAQSDQS